MDSRNFCYFKLRFLTSRKIDRIALPITRACNRRCPECAARGKADSHVSIEELQWVGKLLGPIEKIEVTGGEPSLHPDFTTISENIHKWFQCKDIMLLTNGHACHNLEALLHYDRVYVTHYTQEFANRYGTPTNTREHDLIRDFLAKHPEIKFWSQRMDSHNSLSAPPAKGVPSCFYYTCDSIGYYRGQLYGCCTAWQLSNRGRGIVLTKDWRADLNDIDLPCESCFLSAT